MGLIARNNVTGLDLQIERAQKLIYDELNPLWGGDWDCFPRIYKNKRKDDNGNEYFIPEYLDGVKEYTKDTLFNDRKDVTSFFLEGDNSSVNDHIIETDVSLIFSCKIDKIYTGTDRKDMKMRGDIYKVVQRLKPLWNLINIEIGVDNVYSEFKRDNLTWSDIGKRHLIRYNFKVKYYYNC